MTRDQARAMAALMLAYADGKSIQIQAGDAWVTVRGPRFTHEHKYRIKPEPKEVWVNEYDDGNASSAWKTKELAMSCAGLSATRVAVHYREVCDE